MFWHATLEVARKEVLQLLRTKRMLGIALAFALTLLVMTIVLPASVRSLLDLFDELGGGVATENAVMVFFLSGFLFLSGYFYIQLLPILLTADAVCSEWNQRTVFLLLSKPVPRPAFVVGKFLGLAGAISATVAALMLLDYGIVQFLFPGGPDAGDVGRFFGAVGILVLGVLAFSALALFFSTLTRSTVVSMLLAVTSWIIILPLLSRFDFLIALARHGVEKTFTDPQAAGIGWSGYLSPGRAMEAAGSVLVGGEPLAFLSAQEPLSVWGSVLALVIHTALWVTLALLIVQKRNFE